MLYDQAVMELEARDGGGEDTALAMRDDDTLTVPNCKTQGCTGVSAT